MSKDRAINIIKGAILLELRGKTFYSTIASQAEHDEVKEIFEIMSDEEDQHIKVLKEHYRNILKSGTFSNIKYDTESLNISESVLTEKIQKDIEASGYEAAAISAAMAMEEKAVNFYSEQASAADDPLEKKLFDWLANWEKEHLKLLADIDKDLMEKIWYDNQFWPE